MPVMDIWKVRMAVLQRFVMVNMCMRFNTVPFKVVGMLVMSIVTMLVSVK
jgi:hypothetical protein